MSSTAGWSSTGRGRRLDVSAACPHVRRVLDADVDARAGRSDARGSRSVSARVAVERGIAYRERSFGRRYEFCYRDSEGRWRWQTVAGGRREARLARAEMLARLGKGERVAPSRLRFGEFADRWLAGRGDLRPTTWDRYEQLLRIHLKPNLGERCLSQVDEDDVVHLIACMRAGGSSEGTIRKAVSLLQVIPAPGCSSRCDRAKPCPSPRAWRAADLGAARDARPYPRGDRTPLLPRPRLLPNPDRNSPLHRAAYRRAARPRLG